MMPKSDIEIARRLIAGALADFLTYISTVKDPLIIGGQYDPRRLLRIYAEWCQERGFDNQEPDPTTWLRLCTSGYMRRSVTRGSQPPLEGLLGKDSVETDEKPGRLDLDAGDDLDMEGSRG